MGLFSIARSIAGVAELARVWDFSGMSKVWRLRLPVVSTEIQRAANGNLSTLRWVQPKGLSLLEVVLALAILAIATAYLAQSMELATYNALRAERLTQAELVAESVMNQVIAGVIPSQPGSWTNYVNSTGQTEWMYQLQSVATEVEGMIGLEVAVQKVDPATGLNPARYDLVANRWMIDPSLELDIPSEVTEESSESSGSGSSSSTTSSNTAGTGGGGAQAGGMAGFAGGMAGGFGPGAGGGPGGAGGGAGAGGGGRGGAGGGGRGGAGGGPGAGRGAGAGGGRGGAGGGPGGGGGGGRGGAGGGAGAGGGGRGGAGGGFGGGAAGGGGGARGGGGGGFGPGGPGAGAGGNQSGGQTGRGGR